MNVVQICEEDQEQAFELLAAILWLGNVTFRVIEHDNHVEIEDNEGKSFYIVFCISLMSYIMVSNVLDFIIMC